MDRLILNKYNDNFFSELLSYSYNNTIPLEKYPLLYRQIRKYERCLKKELGKYLLNIKKLSTEANSNRLFYCLVFNYLIRNAESQQLLVESFRNYINQSYPQIELCKDIGQIYFFLNSSEKDAFSQIAKWIIELKTGNELLYCSHCGNLLIPSFDKNYDQYVCSNNSCGQKYKKYHNHCWNCSSTIDSEYNDQCKSCGWYICTSCTKCSPDCSKPQTEKSHNKLTKLPNLQELSENLNNIYTLCISRLKNRNKNQLDLFNDYCSLDRGTKILSDDKTLDTYIAYYGVHHFSKMWLALIDLQSHWQGKSKISVYDWGCGQALASLATLECLSQKVPHIEIEKFVLIDPSEKAVNRGEVFLQKLINIKKKSQIQVQTISNYFDKIKIDNLNYINSSTNLHLFLNILDVKGVSLNDLFRLTNNDYNGNSNYYICTGPDYPLSRNNIDEFYKLFANDSRVNLISQANEGIFVEKYDFKKNKQLHGIVTRFQKIFKKN